MEDQRRIRAWQLAACALRTLEFASLPERVLREAEVLASLDGAEAYAKVERLQRDIGLRALHELEAAAEVLEEQAWLWLKIGHLNWWYGAKGGLDPFNNDESDDNPNAAARGEAAFLQAVEIDPNDPCAHFMLAGKYLWESFPFEDEYEFYSYGDRILPDRRSLRQVEEALLRPDTWNIDDSDAWYRSDPERVVQFVERREKALWESKAGHHLQLFLANGGPDALAANGAFIPELDLEVRYIEDDLSKWHASFGAWSLGAILPIADRSAYYNGMGTKLVQAGWIDERKAPEFFEEARRWGDAQAPEVLQAEINLAKVSVTFDDFSEAALILTRAVQQEPLSALAPDSVRIWLDAVAYLAHAWKTEGDLPADSPLWSLTLSTPRDLLRAAIPASTLALIAEAAGRGAHDRGALDVAENLLLLARECGPELPSVARYLAQLYIQQRRWRQAADEQQRLVDLTNEPYARHILALLREANSGGLSREEQLANHAEIIRQFQVQGETLRQIHLSQELSLNIAAEQARAQRELVRPGTDEDVVIQDLLDQLHNLILGGSQIQLAAVHHTWSQLQDELGPRVLSSLHDDPRQFLNTAEVFYSAAHTTLAALDGALISVEYAKVVETELYQGFLAGLENFMDREGQVRPLIIGECNLTRNPKKGWTGVFRNSRRFGFANISLLIQIALDRRSSQILNRYFDALEFPDIWWQQMRDDLNEIAHVYRNGAAHTERLDRAKLDAFRALLFEGKLLHRLAQLSEKACPAVASQ